MIANKVTKYIIVANIIFQGVLERKPGSCLQFGNGCSASSVIAYPQIGQYEKSNFVTEPQCGHFILPPLSKYKYSLYIEVKFQPSIYIDGFSIYFRFTCANVCSKIINTNICSEWGDGNESSCFQYPHRSEWPYD